MISVIIPVYNQHDMSRECIQTLMETTSDYEIIVIDNGSTPEFVPPFTGWNPAKVIRNDKNEGFPVAVNQGIEAASGDVIVLLNNDVIVTPGSINALSDWLDDYSIISPVTNTCAGIQRIELPVYKNIEQLNSEAESHAAANQGESIDVNWVIGFCMAFKRELWSDLGAFDESLWPCSGEEIDFCFRAREKGHKVGVALDVYMHHIGSRTFSDLEKEGVLEYKALCDRNDAHLAKKWGSNFWYRQLVNPQEFQLEGDDLKLNLGCGRFRLDGFINIDRNDKVNPDLNCDVLSLPFAAGSVSEIYCGHLLEHFSWFEGQEALRYWRVLLKPGGKISVCVPDFDVLIEKYKGNQTPDALRMLNEHYIYSYVQESHHKYCYSGPLLEAALKSAGFTEIKKLEADDPHYTENVDWQIGYEGFKNEDK